MKNLKLIILFAGLLLMVYSCKNQKKTSTDDFKFEGTVEQSDIEVTKSFIYLFPSPGEIMEKFYEAELTFDQSLLHAPSASGDYISLKDKGLNLGVYLTDMAYSALFQRAAQAVDYMDVVKKLSSDLNISSAAFESLIDRARENVGNSDSLVAISNEVFFNMVEFLETSGMENTIAVISCGAYVESMYLSLKTVDKYNREDPIIKQIAELKYPMENLLSHAESVSDDPGVQSILNYINELNDVFMELDAKSSKAEKTAPGVISFTGGKTPEFTEANFDEIKAKVIDIRQIIVGQ